jgi:hypothetical protein
VHGVNGRLLSVDRLSSCSVGLACRRGDGQSYGQPTATCMHGWEKKLHGASMHCASVHTSNRCLPRVCLVNPHTAFVRRSRGVRQAYQNGRETFSDMHRWIFVDGHVERIRDMYVRLHSASSMHAIFFPIVARCARSHRYKSSLRPSISRSSRTRVI